MIASELNPLKLGLSGTKLIEASAGTGKTYAITNLYLRLLLGHGDDSRTPLPVNEILVVTFTIAATDELRMRIRRRIVEANSAFRRETIHENIRGTIKGKKADDFLRQLVDTYPDAELAKRLLGNALQLMDEAAIYTIHGFCARILQDHAFETGMMFDLEMVPREPLLLQACEDFWRCEIRALPRSQLQIVLRQWPSPISLLRELTPVVVREDLVLIPEPCDIVSLSQEISSAVSKLKQQWIREQIPDLLESSDIIKNRKPRASKRLRAMTDFALSSDLEFRFNNESWEIWNTASIAAAVGKHGSVPQHEIFQLFDQLNERFPALRTRLLANIRYLAVQTIRTSLSQWKQHRDQMTFDDLLTSLGNALLDESSGQRLAETIRRYYPVALVDEYQDTDSVQASIFEAIYDDSNTGLFLIGDPKQAIYKFRAADIYTYIRTRRQILAGSGDVFSLDQNWRSTGRLISAVNHLFDHEDVFLNDEDMPFHPVQPGADNLGELCLDGKPEAPVTLFNLTGRANFLKTDARVLAMNYAAEETAMLLNQAGDGRLTVEASPLQAGQIAFLVRDGNDARAAKEALFQRGIHSVYLTLESVFLTPTASQLLLLLQAVAGPTDEGLLRAALASTIMQSSAGEIDTLNHDQIAHQALLAEFLIYHHTWQEQGILAMMKVWMGNREIAPRLLCLPDGERQLTDLRHLGELLQERSKQLPGIHRLIKWFSREIQDAATVDTDERQLRLQSDKNLVKIVTMHSAKGLEYDVVMIPMSVTGMKERLALFHGGEDEQFQSYADLAGTDDNLQKTRMEQLSEDLRLLYVAITRARYKCYIGIANIKSDRSNLAFHETAMAHLLGLYDIEQSTESLSSELRLRFTASELFEFIEVEEVAVTRLAQQDLQQQIEPPPPLPHIDRSWHISSYTSLAREDNRDKSSIHSQQPGLGDSLLEETVLQATGILSRHSFPRGAKVGIMLHGLLEEIIGERHADVLHDLEGIVANTLVRFGYPKAYGEFLCNWLVEILSTPLNENPDFVLMNISARSLAVEMEFHFPIVQSLRLEDLSATIGRAGYRMPQNDPMRTIRGMMTGVIDLTIEFNKEFYIIDYKSNFIGPSDEYYQPDYLATAVADNHYELQYLIYTVALDKYLKARIPGYTYENDFGGVFYLFLRGMSGQPRSGVFHDRPSPDLVKSLGRLFDIHD